VHCDAAGNPITSNLCNHKRKIAAMAAYEAAAHQQSHHPQHQITTKALNQNIHQHLNHEV